MTKRTLLNLTNMWLMHMNVNIFYMMAVESNWCILGVELYILKSKTKYLNAHLYPIYYKIIVFLKKKNVWFKMTLSWSFSYALHFHRDHVNSFAAKSWQICYERSEIRGNCWSKFLLWFIPWLPWFRKGCFCKINAFRSMVNIWHQVF